MAEEGCRDDLADDIWESVFDLLNHRHLESVSLVNKRFLSISNRSRTSLTISDPTILFHRTVSGLLQRFHHLKRIDFVEFRGYLDPIIQEIACSGLNLEALTLPKYAIFPYKSIKILGAKMKSSLKILICSRLYFWDYKELILISKAFPYLEELDISYPGVDQPDWCCLRNIVTDIGIAELSSKLLHLRRINLSGNDRISDSSLLSLSSNCIYLREIVVHDCKLISHKGIGSAILNSPNLVSLSVKGNVIFPDPTSSPNFTIERSYLVGARTLSILDFSKIIISDEYLFLIREAHLPLQKLVLSHCQGFTFAGISSLLGVNQSLNHLGLEGANFLTNKSIEDLSQNLRNLTFISLNSCSNLTSSTFFTLAKNCPYLEEVQMESTRLGINVLATHLLPKNPKIRHLKLARNKYLDNKTLMKLGLICPKLRSLDVSHCSIITEQGIHEIGKSCCDIRELEVNGCGRITKVGTGWKFPKLEVLRAVGSGIDDQGLLMMGQELLCLDLAACSRVTEIGVKNVVKSCKGLKELSLEKCENVSITVFTYGGLSRWSSSLRKIIPPGGFMPPETLMDRFWRHGCMLYNG